MAMPKGHSPHLTGLYVDTATKRLCQRPERKPGVAPPCADDAIQSPGDHMRISKPVTLPEVKWLGRFK
jgi:hypothetical protein